jgi:hypothetical protein
MKYLVVLISCLFSFSAFGNFMPQNDLDREACWYKKPGLDEPNNPWDWPWEWPTWPWFY